MEEHLVFRERACFIAEDDVDFLQVLYAHGVLHLDGMLVAAFLREWRFLYLLRILVKPLSHVVSAQLLVGLHLHHVEHARDLERHEERHRKKVR